MAGGPRATPEVHGQANLLVLHAVDVVRQAAGAAPRRRRSVHVEIVGVEEARRRLLQLDALAATDAVAARSSFLAPNARHQRLVQRDTRTPTAARPR